ncbi:MAG: hypothetical protein Q8Q09_04810 [Deltaproteobacteria bacterium]|nr:hypothetical protein [Deltaproteobacteria bacterium]
MQPLLRRAWSGSWTAAALALAAWISVGPLASCALPATQVEVLIATDFPEESPMSLRVFMREGERTFASTLTRPAHEFNPLPRTIRGEVPSFTLQPMAGSPRDSVVSVRFEAQSGGILVRRDVRFRFLPNQHGYLRILLRAACGSTDTRCRRTEPCTRQAYCEENNQTCGAQGACVSLPVVPSLDRNVPFEPISPSGMDASVDAEPLDDVSTPPPDSACAPSCAGRLCGEDNGCGTPCLDGPCADGEACMAGVCQCAAGFVSCAGACLPMADVQCRAGETRMQSCGTCGSRTDRCGAMCRWEVGSCSGGGTCMPGEMQSEPCGTCGSRARACSASCDWGAWGSCSGGGECTAGMSQTQACGTCGSQSRSCSASCSWGPWGSCSSSGVCTPGQTQSQACGNCGSQTRSCTSSCGWGGWSACTGGGVCTPGTRMAGCDRCGEQVCSSACSWGSCQPRSGSQCLHMGGSNYRSCTRCRNGAQFCLGTCVWSTACCSLGSCPSCL